MAEWPIEAEALADNPSPVPVRPARPAVKVCREELCWIRTVCKISTCTSTMCCGQFNAALNRCGYPTQLFARLACTDLPIAGGCYRTISLGFERQSR